MNEVGQAGSLLPTRNKRHGQRQVGQSKLTNPRFSKQSPCQGIYCLSEQRRETHISSVFPNLLVKCIFGLIEAISNRVHDMANFLGGALICDFLLV